MKQQPYLFLTFDIEEWFTSDKIFSSKDGHSYQDKSDVDETTQWIIDLLNEEGMHGTFFMIADIAKRHPQLLKAMQNGGHEIALHGETHHSLHTLSPDTIADMLTRMKQWFANQFGINLHGYRAPYFSLHREALGKLKEAGFFYDSSVVPCLSIPGWYGSSRAPLRPYFVGQDLDKPDPRSYFLEFPISVHPLFRIPALGGYYFRNLGLIWTRHILRQSLRRLGYAMFYLHPWELSIHLPRAGIPFYMRRRTGQWSRQALQRLLRQAKAEFQPQTITLYDYYQKTYDHVSKPII